MSTASMRGVVPIFAVMGAKNAGNRVREKNAAPGKENKIGEGENEIVNGEGEGV